MTRRSFALFAVAVAAIGVLRVRSIARRPIDHQWIPAGERSCLGCGCTDSRACAGGCIWEQMDPPVCSRCVARSTIVAGDPDIFPDDSWGHDFFDEPPADWVQELGPGERTAMEATLLGKMTDPVVVDRQAARGIHYGRATWTANSGDCGGAE